MDELQIAGVEWDLGNWPKCGKHGVSQADIDHALRHMTFRIPDPNPNEPRLRTAARGKEGRPIFIVYAHRERDGQTWLRPISARYMHGKEIEQYDRIEKAMADAAER